MSRGVIANIESGRKTDITIDQLVALSWALGVPPIALALPLTEPFKYLRVIDGPDSTAFARAQDVAGWFNGEPVYPGFGHPGPGSALTLSLLRELSIYRRAIAELEHARRYAEDDASSEVKIAEAERYLRKTEEHLVSMGVDLSRFEIDD